MRLLLPAFCLLFVLARGASAADSSTEEVTFRVLGFFMEVRVRAFEEAVAKIDGIDVNSVDFERAEATLRLSGPFLPKKGDRGKQLEAVNRPIRTGTRNTFELLPADPVPLEKRERIVIPISGLDCLGCSYGAYRAVFQLEGVHRVTADFGEGLLTAWIDPGKTSRKTLEEELVKKKVLLAGEVE